MNAKVAKPAPPTTSGADIAKYALAVLLLAAGLAGYWFAPWPTPLRALLVAAGLVAGLAVFATTAAGRVGLDFFAEARFELRKVVWPTREASIRTTGVIMAVIVVMSLILALIDFVIGKLISMLLG
jgi:preprotein translocase subunit SecE